MGYVTVAQTVERLEVIKNSKFLALVTPLKNVDEVEGLLEEICSRTPDASHHCFAYKVSSAMRFSDDGEPGGTAGRPMLEVLDKRGLDHVLGVVSRTFGGTKLGAGGLVRAYSGSLAKALDEAGTRQVKDRVTVTLEIPFSEMDSVHRLLDDWAELRKRDPEYSAAGTQLTVSLPEDDLAKFRGELEGLTRGQVKWLKK